MQCQCPDANCPNALLQAYFILDEMLLAGELQEPSKKVRQAGVNGPWRAELAKVSASRKAL